MHERKMRHASARQRTAADVHRHSVQDPHLVSRVDRDRLLQAGRDVRLQAGAWFVRLHVRAQPVRRATKMRITLVA